MKISPQRSLVIALLLIRLEGAYGVEFEPLGNSVAKALKTDKVFPVKEKGRRLAVGGVPEFFKDDHGKNSKKIALIERGLYPPNCTHTWVISLDSKKLKVDQIRVVEMSCPHAFPTKEGNFLDQFKGRGPAEATKLSKLVTVVAKATGSSELTVKAVQSAIRRAEQKKGSY